MMKNRKEKEKQNEEEKKIFSAFIVEETGDVLL